MQILRAQSTPTRGSGDFQIRRVRPGAIVDRESDPALGALACFDDASLARGKVVRMHEHKNDEILTYMVRGTMVHEDSTGHRVPVSANKLMMMNAGASFWHEESVVDGPVEALQIFVRPREADLPAAVAFHDRPDGAPLRDWGCVADAYAFVMTRWSDKVGRSWREYTHVAAFMEAMAKDEAIQDVLRQSQSN